MEKQYPDVMTPQQVAEYLQIDIETVYRQLRAGTLPGGKIGGTWRILKDELDAMIGRKTTPAE